MKSQIIILAFLLVLVISAIVFIESTKVIPKKTPMGIEEVKISLRRQNLSEDDFQRISEKSKKYPLAPELAGIAGYLNTDGEEIRIADYRGKKAVLIDFWTYTCINCIRTLPHLAEWDKKYRDKGLAIIGVHTPEFNFEKEKKNVEMAIKKYGIPYPVVQDNDYATWSAYQNRYWPRKYLVDADGFIRYDHIGEGGYDDTEEMIQKLLMELGPEIAGKDGGIGSIENMPKSALKDTTPKYPLTPELYAGYEFALPRGQDVGNREGLQPGKTINYSLPKDLLPNRFYLEGIWKSNPDDLELIGEKGKIALPFTAKAANIVAQHKDGNSSVFIFIDGKPMEKGNFGDDVAFGGDAPLPEGRQELSMELINKTTINVTMVNVTMINLPIMGISEPRLYNPYKGQYGSHTLVLEIAGKGFTFSAWTFG